MTDLSTKTVTPCTQCNDPSQCAVCKKLKPGHLQTSNTGVCVYLKCKDELLRRTESYCGNEVEVFPLANNEKALDRLSIESEIFHDQLQSYRSTPRDIATCCIGAKGPSSKSDQIETVDSNKYCTSEIVLINDPPMNISIKDHDSNVSTFDTILNCFRMVRSELLILCLPFLNCFRMRFGADCQHVCYCTEGKCDKDGACELGHQCVPGMFGHTCQYVDLIFENEATLQSSPDQALDWLTDYNRSTCNPNTNITKITVSWSKPDSFLGFRLEVDEKAKFKMAPPIHEMDFFIRSETNPAALKCNDKRFVRISSSVLDVKCSLDVLAVKLDVTGTILKFICSIYINGGRNLALGAHVISSSTSANSKLAIDGNPSNKLTDCLKTSSQESKAEITIDLRRDVIVYKVHVIFTEDPKDRPENFEVHLQGPIMKRYEDKSSPAQSHFSVHLSPAKLISVKLKSEGVDPMTNFTFLAVCEAMIFGDCLDENWGLQCENHCPEDCYKNCDAENGWCVKLCDASMDPPCTEDATVEYTYDDEDDANMFGCKMNEPCVEATGKCPGGCRPGFYGPCCKERVKCRPMCKEGSACKSIDDACECKEGLYGERCLNTFPFKKKGCNCDDGVCNEEDGRCNNGTDCVNGWSSSSCLYRDLAKSSTIFPTIPTSYYGSTCSNSTGNSVHAVFLQLVIVASLTIRFHKTSDVKNFSLVFSGGSYSDLCMNSSFQITTKEVTVVEVHWNYAVSAKSVTVSWLGTGSVCSFQILGGRDLTTQNITTPSFYEAGDPNSVERYSLTDGILSTCDTLNSSQGMLEFRFSFPVYVHEVIFYKDYTVNQTGHLLIQSVSDKHVSNLILHIDQMLTQSMFTDATFKSNLVKLQVLNGSLNLCEIEFYGECAPPRYGHSCKKICNDNCPSSRCNYEGECTQCPGGSECWLGPGPNTIQGKDDVMEESDSMEMEKFFLIPLIFFVVIGFADLLLYVLFHKWADSAKNTSEDDNEGSALPPCGAPTNIAEVSAQGAERRKNGTIQSTRMLISGGLLRNMKNYKINTKMRSLEDKTFA
ncbi:hypothetical protein Btru_071833 [Bulinus truncatus]|nr:hypothetical protein Btru_071833 [Bulinus truncatus]